MGWYAEMWPPFIIFKQIIWQIWINKNINISQPSAWSGIICKYFNQSQSYPNPGVTLYPITNAFLRLTFCEARYWDDDGDYLVISHMLHVFISILTCHYQLGQGPGISIQVNVWVTPTIMELSSLFPHHVKSPVLLVCFFFIGHQWDWTEDRSRQSWILKIFHFMIFISNYQIKNLMKTNLSLYDDDEGVGRQ